MQPHSYHKCRYCRVLKKIIPSNDSGSTTYSEACCIDVASTITTLWGIVTQAGYWCTHHVGGTASNAVQSGGNYAHTFVSAVANGVTSNVGNLPNPVTNVAYTPNTGNMVITSNAHNLSTSTITIADNALSPICAMDGNTATKTYPRSADLYLDKLLVLQEQQLILLQLMLEHHQLSIMM